jgi:hypothetical protein
MGSIQSSAKNPPANPLAQCSSFSVESTIQILSGFVFPLSQRKYAVERPMMPLPSITVVIPQDFLDWCAGGVMRGMGAQRCGFGGLYGGH